MPEGNTVWLTARTLRATLAGHVLTHADLRLAEFATTDLVGQRVADVVPRGKHLLIRLEPAGLTLHTHLRMDGRWRTYPADYRVHDPDDHVRVVLANAGGTAVGWRVHDVALVPTSDEAPWSDTSAPTCSALIGTPMRRFGGCASIPTARSAKHSSTSEISRAPATSTRPKSVSCVGFHRGRQLATSKISRVLSTSRIACS